MLPRAKNAIQWKKILNLNMSCRKHHPAEVNLLAKIIKRGISVKNINQEEFYGN